jgi:hypothetical protein
VSRRAELRVLLAGGLAGVVGATVLSATVLGIGGVGATAAAFTGQSNVGMAVGTRPACAAGVAYHQALAGLPRELDLRFGEPGVAEGGSVADASPAGRDAMVTGADLTLAPGLVQCDDTSALQLPGGASQSFVASPVMAVPSELTLVAWVRPGADPAGRLVGLADTAAGSAGTSDRALAVRPDGRAAFVVAPAGVIRELTSPQLSAGRAHLLVATLGAAGAALYVDGALVAAEPAMVGGASYPGAGPGAPYGVGSWRVGWSGSGGQFGGGVDEIAVLPVALTAEEVAIMHQADHW